MKRLFTEMWISVFIFLGCAGLGRTDSFAPTKATGGYITAVHKDLISLPEAKEKIVVAVYKFRDQTGQYKPGTTGTTFSTAVTQGATSMLIEALEESKWFIPIEREGLPNLLNERQIIRSTRMQYQAEGKEDEKISLLPPLLYAGVILEGGIISYDTDIITGGFGARYFGLGGSSQLRRDQVAIYLRAVSTQNGMVLKSVSTTKTVLSKEVALGVYRFVSLQRLLEVEGGLTTNEPPQLCVLEAIEKAVFDLIVEGVRENLWAFKNPEDINSPIIQNYLKEKEGTEKFLQFDRKGNLAGARDYPKRLSFGFQTATQKYTGDYSSELKPSYELFVRYGITPSFSLLLSGGRGELGNKNDFDTDILRTEIKGLLTLFPEKKLTPYVFLGGGALNYWARDKEGKAFKRNREYGGWQPMLVAGLGMECFLNKNLSLHTAWSQQFTSSDQLDGFVKGSNDYFWKLGVGFSYYLAY